MAGPEGPDGMQRWEPPAVLRPYVASVSAYDVDLGGPGVHAGLPGTTLTLVLPVGQPLDVAWARDPATRRSGWSSVAGLHGQPAAIHHDGHQAGVQLALTLAGARALLGVPAAALAGELLELTDVAPGLADLPERLAGEPTWPGRRRLVEQALLAALARSDDPRPRAEVGRALAGLTRGAPVASVADDVGYSRRHLTTLVRAECGVSPKTLQRVARFETSLGLLRAAALAGRPRLADVGARAGYADQAHLTREWQDLAGCTPTHWLRTELPFLQDPGPGEAAG